VGSSFQISGDWKARPLLRIRYGGELGESGLEIFDDLGSDDVGIGKIAGVFEA
jgi:hypothetical protein